MIVNKRSGISTFIATLLLMVLAVSAGVVIYAYTMGYLGGFGGPKTLGSISIDTWTFWDDPATPAEEYSLTVYVHNIAKTSFDLDAVYINGALVAKKADFELALQENEVKQLTIFYGATAGAGYYPWATGKTYDVKIVGADNTQVSFQVKK